MACSQNPGISNHMEERGGKRKKVKEQNLSVFPSNFSVGCRKAEIPGGWTSYQETSSGFSFVMIKTWQRIFKTPDKIIDFFFLKHAVKDETEQTYKLLRNCSHLLSAFMNIFFTHLVGRMDVKEESEQSPLLPQKRNGPKAPLSLHRRAPPLNYSGKGVKECSQSPAEHRTQRSTQYS